MQKNVKYVQSNMKKANTRSSFELALLNWRTLMIISSKRAAEAIAHAALAAESTQQNDK